MSDPIKHTIPIDPASIGKVGSKAALEELLAHLEGLATRNQPTHVIGLDVATAALRLRIIGLQGELMVASMTALANDGKRPKDGWTLIGADFEVFTYEAPTGSAAHKAATELPAEPKPMPEMPADEWLPNGKVVCYRRDGQPRPEFDYGRTGAPVWSTEYQAYRYVVSPATAGLAVKRPQPDADDVEAQADAVAMAVLPGADRGNDF